MQGHLKGWLKRTIRRKRPSLQDGHRKIGARLSLERTLEDHRLRQEHEILIKSRGLVRSEGDDGRRARALARVCVSETPSGEQGGVLLVESCRLEETLGDGEKLSLTIKMARERDSERLAVRPEARGYRH